MNIAQIKAVATIAALAMYASVANAAPVDIKVKCGEPPVGICTFTTEVDFILHSKRGLIKAADGRAKIIWESPYLTEEERGYFIRLVRGPVGEIVEDTQDEVYRQIVSIEEKMSAEGARGRKDRDYIRMITKWYNDKQAEKEREIKDLLTSTWKQYKIDKEKLQGSNIKIAFKAVNNVWSIVRNVVKSGASLCGDVTAIKSLLDDLRKLYKLYQTTSRDLSKDIEALDKKIEAHSKAKGKDREKKLKALVDEALKLEDKMSRVRAGTIMKISRKLDELEKILAGMPREMKENMEVLGAMDDNEKNIRELLRLLQTAAHHLSTVKQKADYENYDIDKSWADKIAGWLVSGKINNNKRIRERIIEDTNEVKEFEDKVIPVWEPDACPR